MYMDMRLLFIKALNSGIYPNNWMRKGEGFKGSKVKKLDRKLQAKKEEYV